MTGWHYLEEGVTRGPVSEEDLLRLIADGRLGATDLVWAEDLPDWQEVRRVPALASPGGAAVSREVSPETPDVSRGSGAMQTSGKAVGSLVCSILGFTTCAFIGQILGLALGYSARKDIAASGGRLGGQGVATAGIVLAWVGLLFYGVLALLWILMLAQMGMPMR